MRSVVLIHGVLRGMGLESECEMLALKATDSESRSVTYSRCSVIQTASDLPDGEYTLTFAGTSVIARREGGLWLANGDALSDAA